MLGSMTSKVQRGVRGCKVVVSKGTSADAILGTLQEYPPRRADQKTLVDDKPGDTPLPVLGLARWKTSVVAPCAVRVAVYLPAARTASSLCLSSG